VTIITSVTTSHDQRHVRGTSASNTMIKAVLVNGQPAKSVRANYAEWEITLPASESTRLEAFAEDNAGNVETLCHRLD
jgi:hypothetical protein